MKQKLRNKLKSMLKNIICIISFKNILHHGMLKEVNILVYFHFCNEIYQFIICISLIRAPQLIFLSHISLITQNSLNFDKI